jgi:hypothetical protein
MERRKNGEGWKGAPEEVDATPLGQGYTFETAIAAVPPWIDASAAVAAPWCEKMQASEWFWTKILHERSVRNCDSTHDCIVRELPVCGSRIPTRKASDSQSKNMRTRFIAVMISI